MMAKGALMVAVGLAITGGTYYFAGTRGGGTYLVAWGPVVFGVITIIRGLVGARSG